MRREEAKVFWTLRLLWLARLSIASKPDSLILAALEIIATGRSAHSRFSEPVASQLANDG
jgi:hypothetical protein